MRQLNASETAARLPYPALADALRDVLRLRARGIAHAPPRLIMPLADDGLLLLMPATDGEIAITKLATAHTGNAARRLPVIQAEVTVMDAATGERRLMLDGATVTARRTAALSLLAAQTLAPHPGGQLLILGAGTQGLAHLEAFSDGLSLTGVSLWSRGREKTLALAERAAARGLPVNVLDTADELDDAAQRSDLIVAATTSASPVVPERVGAGAFIAAVGAFKPGMAELPAALVKRARVFVDTLEGAQAEAGDLIQAGVDWSRVVALEAALDAPRPTAGPVVFKSVGHALWDLAAARLALVG